MRPVFLAMLLWALLLSGPEKAHAHGVHLFAAVENGSEIAGYAYFSGGVRVADSPVKVLAPDGRLLAEVVTDADGNFRFESKERVDHRFVLELPDGHHTEWTVKAADLPGALPTSGVPEPAREPTPEKGEPAPESEADVRLILREELAPVQAQLVQYREELAAYRSEIRWSDAIAGVGYLIGVAGIASFLLMRKREGGA